MSSHLRHLLRMSAAAAASRTRRMGLGLGLAAVLMFGFGFAMIPLYYRFCALLGIPTARDGQLLAPGSGLEPDPEQEALARKERPLQMEFVTQVSDAVLSMVPSVQKADMTTGKAYSVSYELKNLTGRELIGRAVPSYVPLRAGRWLKKLQCFCFAEIKLAPGEVRQEPVVFLLAGDLPADIETVTMSYVFYEQDASRGESS